jgi:hypothetical protein
MATERAAILRPDPTRGDLVAAAAVALTLTVSFINSRFDAEWGEGIHLIYTALAAAAVIAMATFTPRPTGREAAATPEGDVVSRARPSTWQSVLFVAAFILFVGTLSTLADVLGSDGVFESPGTNVWVGLLAAGLAFWFATGWNSGISTLLGAVTLIVVILSFIDWVFDPDDLADTFRWILLLVALGFGAVGASRRRSEPHHATGWVNAAGLAVLGIALTFAIQAAAAAFGVLSGGEGAIDADTGTGWELVVLAGGMLLIAYSVLTANAGPGYLGFLNLLAFGALASTPDEDGASLIGWPVVLLLLTAALLALAFRRDGATGAGVTARPSPDPSESPTAVQQQP